MFTAWWFPFSRFGVIHGDPHLGNYTVFDRAGRREARPASTCSTTAASAFSRRNSCGGVVDLYHGLLHGDDDLVVHAYETWGFRRLSRDLIDTLNIWARFIYAPLLDDRVRTIADGVAPAEYGRREAFRVHQALKQKGPVTVPREFVFMDRAAIGLGARVPASARRAQFLSAVQRGDRAFLDGARRRAPAGGAFRRRVIGAARSDSSRVVIPDCRESGKSGIHSHRSGGIGAEFLLQQSGLWISGSRLTAAPRNDDFLIKPAAPRCWLSELRQASAAKSPSDRSPIPAEYGSASR